MTKTHPYHIIEVNCGWCSFGYQDGANEIKCPDCNGTGRGQMAVWQLRKHGDKIVPLEDGRWILDELGDGEKVSTFFSDKDIIIHGSPYQEDDILESGEKIGEIELKPITEIIDYLPLQNNLPESKDTWLCCAYIEEKE